MNQCFIGDCRDTMRQLIADGVRVQMSVTSPPYWGLRDYGHADQLGLEKTPDEYVSRMVDVFRLVRELLADDGCIWVNLGDSYAAQRGGTAMPAETLAGGVGGKGDEDAHRGHGAKHAHRNAIGLKHKDLVGIPWMVAFALRADGWYLRSDIIWSKPNPMPESVTDRPTKSHEYIFLLSKKERYYYDAAAIAEPLAYGSIERLSQPTLDEQHGSDRVPGKTNGPTKAVARASWKNSTFDKGKTGEMMQTRGGLKPYAGKATKDYAAGGAQDASATKARIVDSILAGDLVTRNKRSVWTVTTKPFSGAHFATFPPDLIEPCILAGSKPGDIVLDPFFGSGTTGEVAQRLGRQWIGCELNEAYEPLQKARTAQLGMQLS